MIKDDLRAPNRPDSFEARLQMSLPAAIRLIPLEDAASQWREWRSFDHGVCSLCLQGTAGKPGPRGQRGPTVSLTQQTRAYIQMASLAPRAEVEVLPWHA